MPKIDLLPCPFCGKIETLKMQTVPSNPSEYRVLCDTVYGGCGASIGWDHRTAEEAAKSWNTRASGWISCSERMPKETGLLNGYLCSIGDCITIMPFFDGKFQAWMDNGKFIVPDPYVEFWMPLPKSPEEEVK